MSRHHHSQALRFALVLLAGAGVVSGCGDDDVDFGVLEGSVTLDGSSVRGVTLQIAGDAEATVETGPLGGYAIELFPGDYTVTLSDGLPPDVVCSPALSQDVTILLDVVSEANFACETTTTEAEEP